MARASHVEDWFDLVVERWRFRLNRGDRAALTKSDESEGSNRFSSRLGVPGLAGRSATPITVEVSESADEAIDEGLEIRQGYTALCTLAFQPQRYRIQCARSSHPEE